MFVVVGVAAVEKSVVITAVETILFDDGVVLDEVTGGDGVFDEVTGDGIDDNGNLTNCIPVFRCIRSLHPGGNDALPVPALLVMLRLLLAWW